MDDKRGNNSKQRMKVEENDVVNNGEQETQNITGRDQLFVPMSAVVNLLHTAIERIISLSSVNRSIHQVKKVNKSTQTVDETEAMISTGKSMHEHEDVTAGDYFSDYLRNQELYKALWKPTTQHENASNGSEDQKMKDIEEVNRKSNFNGRQMTEVMHYSSSFDLNGEEGIETHQLSSSIRQLHWSQSTADMKEGGMAMGAVTWKRVLSEESQDNTKTGTAVG
uniref:Uncharacterized protein n=1 Tax=Trichobilharzia regenti TaxID=157069 RepID=A0AA85IZQ2_TRIRE|nr:unnamed protein product [Trichobilharzia regenti]